jgi:hypothetical protein
MISVRSQNTLLHSMTHHFEYAVREYRANVKYGLPSARSVYLETLRRIMTAARELNPRYPAVVARIGGKR